MTALFDIQPNSTLQGKSNEWYTPSRYIEAAREVMGSIDLDPASCELANRVVKAKRYYSKEDDGLSKAWYGNVWLNPPYSSPFSTVGLSGGKLKGQTGVFIAKLIEHFEQGDIKQATICVNADTNRSWFQKLWLFPICFADHKVWFNRLNLPPSGQFFGAVFVYLGPHEQKFIDVFSQFGRIARAIDMPPSRPIAPSLWEVQAP